MNTYSRARAEVDLDAVLHNVKAIRDILSPGTKIMAVIKVDGYGHGAVPIARELEALPYIWGYGVATAEEGLILRHNGLQKPVLVLGATFPEQYKEMAREDIRITLFSIRQANQIEETLRDTDFHLKAHVKIDTGLNRLGFPITREAAGEIAQIGGFSHMILEGVFTHFATADAADKTMANQQFSAFCWMQSQLKERGIDFALSHAGNSGAIIDMPESNMDMVRAGIILYGLWPSDEVHKERLPIKPVLSLKSQIVFLKEIPEGKTISYGATYTVNRTSKIATIPIGYGDGYPRSLSNKGYVLIRGRKAPICGRICMDQFMVDVTDIPGVMEGDEVVLVGQSGEEALTLEALGDLSGRFNYEFACDLGRRIPRIYYKDHTAVEVKDYFGE